MKKFTFTIHWMWDSERWGAMDVSVSGETREAAQETAEKTVKVKASKRVARNCSTVWSPKLADMIRIRHVSCDISKAA